MDKNIGPEEEEEEGAIKACCGRRMDGGHSGCCIYSGTGIPTCTHTLICPRKKRGSYGHSGQSRLGRAKDVSSQEPHRGEEEWAKLGPSSYSRGGNDDDGRGKFFFGQARIIVGKPFGRSPMTHSHARSSSFAPFSPPR